MQYGGPGRGFVGPEAYTVYGAPFKKYKVTITKLGTKVNTDGRKRLYLFQKKKE